VVLMRLLRPPEVRRDFRAIVGGSGLLRRDSGASSAILDCPQRLPGHVGGSGLLRRDSGAVVEDP